MKTQYNRNSLRAPWAGSGISMYEACSLIFKKSEYGGFSYKPYQSLHEKVLEEQLDKELKKDNKVLCITSRRPRIKWSRTIKQSTGNLEDINKWELNNLWDSQEVVRYAKRVKFEIMSYIETNTEEMLKNEWVKESSVIKEPCQMLNSMIKQKTGRFNNKFLGNFGHLIESIPSIKKNGLSLYALMLT